MKQKTNQKGRDAKLHFGHRERMRTRFVKTDGVGMNDHELLETLLFYSIPRCDTNETAHRLLDAFGSLAGVINAPLESLACVDGLGSGSAVLIKLIGVLMNRYATAELQSTRLCVKHVEDAVPYLERILSTKPTEELYMLMFRDTGMLIGCDAIMLGGDSTSLHTDTGKCVRAALQNSAAFVILGHNHPNGALEPSKGDIRLTQHLEQILSAVNVTLAEHIVIAGKQHLFLKSYMQSHSAKNAI